MLSAMLTSVSRRVSASHATVSEDKQMSALCIFERWMTVECILQPRRGAVSLDIFDRMNNNNNLII